MRIGRNARTARIGTTVDDALYERFYPYYAELCALSEIRKKPGLGIQFRSGMGGHSLLYLSGVCLNRTAGYPTLELCEPGAVPGRHGVAISVNSHYKNANWVAAEGHEFAFCGALESGERLDVASYARTQERAKATGVLDGVEFHDHLFRDKPRGMSRGDYMYEISVGTDYAVRFGRNTYRARVPLDRTRMSAIVDFLNALNAPYRDGAKVFRWRILNNNCSHVAHNALATAGIWTQWPTGQFFAVAAFKFPVPKNEFVDLMLRTNDLPIQDAPALYEDRAARRALLDADTLPTAPGGLAIAEAAIQDNDIYDIEGLRLIFYDNAIWGPYRGRFARIFGEPHYFDLRANLQRFAALYEAAQERRRRAHGIVAPSGDREQFYGHYDRYIAREAARVGTLLASLTQPAGIPAAALS